MRDKISIERINLLHPRLRDEARICIELAELSLPVNTAIRCVQGLRTIEEQNDLYAKGRTVRGPKVTNAKGGSSYHNYGLALDFALLVDTDNNGSFNELSWDIRKDNDRDGVADWLEVVRVFESYDWEWGGRWHSLKDYPHVQKTFGLSWREMFKRYNNKEFIPHSRYINIY